MNKKKLDPYQGRMRAMLLFAFFPLLILLAQPLGGLSVWLPVIIIGRLYWQVVSILLATKKK